MSRPWRLAAIDIGTVTTRLLIADVSDSGVVEIARSTDITHLGEGLASTGQLGEAAMERVSQVIARYDEMMREHGVERFAAMATSASRDAQNSAEFMDLLASRGITPLVIPGEVEARLSFVGATSGMEAEEDLLVVDLGGGSTELIVGNVVEEGGARSPEIVKARSIDVGSRRVTELFLHSDPPTAAELAEAREWSVGRLRPYFDGLRERPELMVALAGTATTLSAIRQELEVYDPALVHGSCLTGSDLADLVEMLSAMPLAERLGVRGLDPGRATVIVAGALILETVLALAGLDSTLVSEHDILYGILLETYDDLREDRSGSEQEPGA